MPHSLEPTIDNTFNRAAVFLTSLQGNDTLMADIQDKRPELLTAAYDVVSAALAGKPTPIPEKKGKDKLVGIKEAAKLCRIGESAMRNRIKRGLIDSKDLVANGNRTLIRREAIIIS